MLAYLLAVLAACANAASSVLQRKANTQVPVEREPGLGLIARLLRRPVWFAGFACALASFLLQAAALGSGELSLVEPILVIELPLTLVIAAKVFGSRLGRREWLAIAGMTVGLAGLLLTLAPSPSAANPKTPWPTWLIGIGVNLAAVAICVAAGRRSQPAREHGRGGGRRAAAFGVAAGCQFGLTAALMKGMTERYSQGFAALFTGWQLYAMALSGLLSMFLLQAALNAGRLVAAQPGLTLGDPLVSVLWGALAFDERLRGGWFTLPAIAAGALLTGAVVELGRSPLLDADVDVPSDAAAQADAA